MTVSLYPVSNQLHSFLSPKKKEKKRKIMSSFSFCSQIGSPFSFNTPYSGSIMAQQYSYASVPTRGFAKLNSIPISDLAAHAVARKAKAFRTLTVPIPGMMMAY